MGQDADWDGIAPAKYLGVKIIFVQHFFFCSIKHTKWGIVLANDDGHRAAYWKKGCFGSSLFSFWGSNSNLMLSYVTQYSSASLLQIEESHFLAQTEPAPDRGISITRWRGGYYCLPLRWGTTPPIYKNKTAFDRPGTFIRWKFNVVDIGVTDGLTG